MTKVDLSTVITGNQVAGLAALIEGEIRQASNGPYFQGLITDGASVMAVKAWQYRGSLPTLGCVYNIKGRVDAYKGQLSINLTQLELTEEDMDEFRQRSADPPKKLFEKTLECANLIKNEPLRLLTIDILTSHVNELLVCPAAKRNHHNYVGGLLEHTLEVVQYGTAIGELNGCRNLDYILAGALLHDIGKVCCYTWKGCAVENTDEDLFSGHIAKGYLLVCKTAEQLGVPKETAEHLGHIILSHHGKPEWGSIEPRFAEAFIVHMADYLSSTLVYFNSAKGKEDSNWSEKVWPLNRVLYTGKL